jgi:hypothetical protein
MSPKPSRLVAVVASLALAACSSIGVINGQRLDVGAAPQQAAPAPPHQGYICEDMEFLCIVGVGGLIALIVVLATVHGSTPGPNASGTATTP